MIDPSTLIALVTVGVSIWAFQDRRILSALILSPYAVVHQKQWYRVITHAFIHADWMHLLFNMIALWSFGKVVYTYFSYITPAASLHFFILYFIGSIIASIHDLVKHKNDTQFLSLGASGAVSAVVFTAIFFDPWSTILIFFIPCPAILFGIVYILYSSYMSKKGGDYVNHNAHLYGAIWGFFYPLLLHPDSLQFFLHNLMRPRLFS